MKKNIFFPMLAATLLLASCSQTDELLQPTPETGKVTFTAYIDGNSTNNLRSASTRAEDTNDATDEAISRAVLEVHNEDGMVGEQIVGVINSDGKSIQFEADGLEKGATYTCYFWADGGDDAYDITSLTAITRGTAPSIAYHASEEITADGVTKDITLTHAVAKVILQEVVGDDNEGLAADDKVKLAFELPTYTFDVSAGNAQEGTGTEYIAKEVTIASGGITTTSEIVSLYVFATAAETTPVTMVLSYTPNSENPRTHTMTNVPLKLNHRTILRGAFETIGAPAPIDYTFTATLDKDWEDYYEVGEIRYLITTEVGQVTSDMLDAAINKNGSLIIEGPLDGNDMNTIKRWASVVANIAKLTKLDMGGVTELTAIPTDAFWSNPLTEVVIPASITTIGMGAFSDASTKSLKSVIFEGTLPMTVSNFTDNNSLAVHTAHPFFRAEDLIVFLPNITEKEIASTYGSYFTNYSISYVTDGKVYYDYQDIEGDNDRTNVLNYTPWSE